MPPALGGGFGYHEGHSDWRQISPEDNRGVSFFEFSELSAGDGRRVGVLEGPYTQDIQRKESKSERKKRRGTRKRGDSRDGVG